MIAAGVIAVLLAALFATRVGARASYGKDGLRLWLVAGFVRKEIKLGEKQEKPPEEQSGVQFVEVQPEPPVTMGDMPESAPEKSPKKKDKSPLIDSFDKKKLIKLAFRAVPKAIKLPRIDLLEFHYVAGGETADRTAMRYGKMCAALGAGLPFLHNGLRVKNQVISTDLDYTRVKQEFSGKIQVTLTIGAAFAFGIWALIELVRCRKEKDNGQQTDNR